MAIGADDYSPGGGHAIVGLGLLLAGYGAFIASDSAGDEDAVRLIAMGLTALGVLLLITAAVANGIALTERHRHVAERRDPTDR